MKKQQLLATRELFHLSERIVCTRLDAIDDNVYGALLFSFKRSASADTDRGTTRESLNDFDFVDATCELC